MDTPSYQIGDIYPETDENQNNFLEFTDEKPFRLGKRYGDSLAKQIKCKKCTGTNFHVGQGDFYTAIRCVACDWEMGIHEG